MKRKLYTLALCLLWAGAGKAQKFELDGTVRGVGSGMVVLYYSGSGQARSKDSAAIREGKFRLSGTVSEPNLAYLSLKEEKRNEANSLSFFLEPGKIELSLQEGAFASATVRGSASQDAYGALVKAKKRVEEKYRRQLDSLRTERDHEKNAEIRERLAPYFAESDLEDYRFFRQHPRSVVTAYMLRFHTGDLSLDSLQRYYDGLGYVTQQTDAGKLVLEELVKLRGGSPGSLAKDFTAMDIEGKTLRLSDYRGKYVLIDFWASWCVPCRKGNPHLKELYARYRDKGLEIIGIADDDRALEAWKDAVAKDGIGMWKHVRRGLKYVNGNYDRSEDISEKFGIHTLPTKILVDPEGMIIGRFSEDEVPLDRKLVAVFGK